MLPGHVHPGTLVREDAVDTIRSDRVEGSKGLFIPKPSGRRVLVPNQPTVLQITVSVDGKPVPAFCVWQRSCFGMATAEERIPKVDSGGFPLGATSLCKVRVPVSLPGGHAGKA